MTETANILPAAIENGERGKGWDKKLTDPIITEVTKAFKKQKEKPHRVIDLEYPDGRDGIHYLPGWESYELIAIGQRKGTQDLFPRGSSAHNVSFCTAEFRGPKGLPLDLPVAIKTFTSARNALEDAVANQYALDRGFNTTHPICVITNSQHSYVITQVRKDVQPLDTEPWHQFNSGSIEVRQHFLSRLTGISELLANLHANGINHADPQVKNFWVTPEGEIETFDWEAARILDNPPTPEQLQKIAIQDLATLYKSLTGQFDTSPIPAFLGPRVVKWKQFKRHVFDVYVNEFGENLFGRGELTDELLETITSVEEPLKKSLNI